MPFTSAHVAAVIPFKRYTRTTLSSTGLVIGSMVPDFEYFARMTLYGHYGHTLGGIFFFDIPLGLVLFFLYNAIIRKTLIEYLPAYLYDRFARYKNFDWQKCVSQHYFRLFFSLFIGILTHFLWDGFTHDEEYYLARFIPVLLSKINVFGIRTPLYAFLQNFSTLIGMIIVGVYIHKLPQQIVEDTRSKREIKKFWFYTGLVAVLIGVIRWSLGMPNEKLFGQLIVVSVSASLLSLLLICFIYSKKDIKLAP